MSERFDIYDDRGEWIGTATRQETHARGYWHHTIHVWVARVREDGGVSVLFQRRSADKDTNPGYYDITCAGHLSAGESPREAVRELEEELGVTARFEELVPYGTITEEACGETAAAAYIDREVSHVFALLRNAPPSAYRLQPEEVAGLYEADCGELIRLMEGAVATVTATGIALASAPASGSREGGGVGGTGGGETGRGDGTGDIAGGTGGGTNVYAGTEWIATPHSVEVTASQFVPRNVDHYIGVFRFLQGQAEQKQ